MLPAGSGSHIIDDTVKYVKFDRSGLTQLVNNKNPAVGYKFRQVHETVLPLAKQQVDQNVFIDSAFNLREDKSLQSIDTSRKVVLERLAVLVVDRKNFFPTDNKITIVADQSKVPPVLNELPLLPIEDYKSLFITQSFAPNGKYELIINQFGRFEHVMVDDLIPVYEDTKQPIWGQTVKRPWEIILLKAYAKKCGGYLNVLKSNSFEFVECVSNSNWKYFNLSKEGDHFLNHYYSGHRFKKARIILKTKNSAGVANAGLLPNQCYKLVSIHNENPQAGVQKSQLQPSTSRIDTSKIIPIDQAHAAIYTLLVHSSFKHKWSGKMSVLDNNLNSKYEMMGYQIALEHDFFIGKADFLNLFSSAYITSNRDLTDYFTGYKMIQIKANTTKAAYFKFTYNKETTGFFDFSVKQLNSNKIVASDKSSIEHIQQQKNQGTAVNSSISTTNPVNRFLKSKYILIKDNKDLLNKIPNDEVRTRYETYEIEYLKGYNRGDAHFVSMSKGNYILRLKSETINKDAKYVINYCSDDCNINIEEILNMTNDDKVDMLRDAFVSIMHKSPRVFPNREERQEILAFGNTFEEIGYCYIAVKCLKKAKNEILVEVDPEKLAKDGYVLKSKFKNQKNLFSVLIKKGEYAAIILRKVKGALTYTWPPSGISYFSRLETQGVTSSTLPASKLK